MGLGNQLKHAWNAFVNQDDSLQNPSWSYGGASGSGTRPDRVRLYISNERSIISSIYTRLAIDIASIDIKHIRLDDQDRYIGDIDSGLNNCLTIEANLDQEARDFRQDIAMTLFDKGVAVLVPVDTSISPLQTGGFDILTMRIGEVVQWFPKHVRVSVYNETTGRREEITLPKKTVAIIYNPLYSVMNESNSTLQRLIRKLNLLDSVDEQSSSGKLDMIIQLPYVIKSEARRQQAEQRRSDIEFQLKGSKYGIAYTDGTEKITQLNRPVDNNLLTQIESLKAQLYTELGVTAAVMDGTADEKAMLNYINRTLEPVLGAIAGEIKRKFLTKTARSQKQSVDYFRDPFKLVPMSDLAEMVDKFTRNEVVSSNEMRGFMGLKPSSDPKADQLINSNMPQPAALPSSEVVQGEIVDTPEPLALPAPVLDVDSVVEDVTGEFDTTVENILGGE